MLLGKAYSFLFVFGGLFDLTLNNAFTMVQLSDSGKLKKTSP